MIIYFKAISAQGFQKKINHLRMEIRFISLLCALNECENHLSSAGRSLYLTSLLDGLK